MRNINFDISNVFSISSVYYAIKKAYFHSSGIYIDCNNINYSRLECEKVNYCGNCKLVKQVFRLKEKLNEINES